jgi:hypothetical protein
MINFGRNVKYAQMATVWKIEDKETHAVVSISTSRKDKKTEQYVNSNWSFVRFVGNAYNEELLGLQRGTRIEIHSAAISLEPYLKDGEKAYPKNPQIVVFAWGLPEGRDDNHENNVQETVEEEDDGQMPF